MTSLNTAKSGEDGIGAIFFIDDLIAIYISVGKSLGVAVKPSLHLCPPVLKLGLGAIIGSWIGEDLYFGQ